jgi:hypothetical protein
MIPKLELLPNRRYALDFEFAHPEFAGALTLRGTSLSRVYYLPDAGYGPKTATPSRTFGALPGRPRTVTLWTDRTAPEIVSIQFFFNDPAAGPKITSFGRFVFREISLETLPVRISTWSPLRATVTAPVAAYLETPRFFLEGYQAKVDGKIFEVKKSPSALAMFPVPAGTSEVELSYRGPLALRLAYFFSLTGWIALVGGFVIHRRRLHREFSSIIDTRKSSAPAHYTA